VDLTLSDEQQALQEMIAGFAADRFEIDTVVRAFGEPGGFDRAAWAGLAELGTFGIALPEEQGGVGLGAIDAVLVHEALAAGLVPGPLVPATLAAGLVDGVIDGSVVPALLERPAHGPVVVEHLRDADVLLVLDDDGISKVDAAGLGGTVLPHPTDPITPVTVLDAVPDGERIAGPDVAREWRRLGSLLASAQLVGLSEATTSVAVEYAKERQQFGKPIGTFQGLKHLLADCYMRTEVARSAVWSAGVNLDEPEAGDIDRALASARLMAARAATENGKTGIQVHGGMGFTWEVVAHLYLKRAWVLETQFGNPDDAAELVAAKVAG
jgi:alkylation response protein AidB-like acyl-CoA dehydrogenase